MASTSAPTSGERMCRLMLVDDEPHVLTALRRNLMRALADEAVEIETFDDPRRALARAAEADFALVMSDYRMPPMDGVTFLKQFRISQPHAIRLVLSATSDVDTLLGAINEAEIFRYVLKPWDDVELGIAVRSALTLYAEQEAERQLAEETRARQAALSPEEIERRRLEAEEPGITEVRWGPGGSVLLDDE